MDPMAACPSHPGRTRGGRPLAIVRRMRAMRRRFVTWFALFAMLTSLAVPAHAYAHLRAPGGMAADFCTTKSAQRAPAAPHAPHATACDACASCMPSAIPGADRAPPVVAAGYLRAVLANAPEAAALRYAHFEARAPPLLP